VTTVDRWRWTTVVWCARREPTPFGATSGLYPFLMVGSIRGRAAQRRRGRQWRGLERTRSTSSTLRICGRRRGFRRGGLAIARSSRFTVCV
jgi:hypothetical protein